jgi:hypothetical protein
MPRPPEKVGLNQSQWCAVQAGSAEQGAFEDELGRAATRAAWKTIEVTSSSGWIRYLERVASAIGSAVDHLREEALLRMAIAGDGDEFPDSSAALMIALAVEYKVHGFAGLRPDEALV